MNISEHNKRLVLLPHDMLQCSCGNIERRAYANDGRGSAPTLESSRLVVDTTQATSTRVFVRSEVGLQRIVSFIDQEVASTNRGRSFEEDQSFVTLAISASSTKVTAYQFPASRLQPLCDATLCSIIARRAMQRKVSYSTSCFL